MNLQEKLVNITNNIDKYFIEEGILSTDLEISNWVLDIEACQINDDEMLTYSIALMSADNESAICYKFNKIETVLEQLFKLPSKTVNIYIHNLYYDFKPFLTTFVENYGAIQNVDTVEEKEILNPFTKRKEIVKIQKTDDNDITKDKYTYDICFKKGVLYQAKFYGELRKDKKIYKAQQICFRDTLKIAPFSLKKCCKDFLELELSKEGLDYEKIRNIDDVLTPEEKKYIYEDVYGLKWLVKKLIVDGVNINGKEVKYYKLTNSSQSLYDYKLTLLEDYNNKDNIFKDIDIYDEIDTKLLNSNFFKYEGKEKVQADILFKKVFPPLNIFVDSFIRDSYFGGLSMVDYENVRKYEKYENKIGQVFDVNSLYPFIMSSRILPYGHGLINKKPYKYMSKKYKEKYKIYFQKIIIHDMELKPNKTKFIQVKHRSDFNGRETISENINIFGEKVSIELVLCNPLLDLLFDNYNVKSYELGEHVAYKGTIGLFNNYLEFWGDVKRNSKGCNRAISKLRQNGLYGKFGTNPNSEITYITSVDSKWNVITNHENYITDNIYIPIASAITSWAKKYLVDSINQNRDKFLYCDTDSLHVFGELNDIKGLFIDSKQYGAWKHEITFNDFKYLGAKRYAEKDSVTGEWDIKCCGLTSEIMKSIKDIDVFGICKHTSKEISKMKLYTKKTDNYYYYDKECTKKIKGLFKSKKSKIVKNGTSISEQPYMITNNQFLL